MDEVSHYAMRVRHCITTTISAPIMTALLASQHDPCVGFCLHCYNITFFLKLLLFLYYSLCGTKKSLDLIS